ncbi:hypothetical protein PPE03_34490 [Pseudoalteromonas peptidolytica]|nr:hypothetical protein PPE03_34490 [Pseudoalteromonas peptidolytica]
MTTAGAAFADTHKPITSPNRHKGKVPNKAINTIIRNCSKANDTPENKANILIKQATINEKTEALTHFAKRYWYAETGDNCLRTNQPFCFSIATFTPNENNAGLIIPNIK